MIFIDSLFWESLFMAQVNLADYKNLYLQTAKEYIEKISISLDELSINSLNKEALNNLHIASHSLKSQSQVMGSMEIANICLDIENKSNDALQGAAQLNSEAVLDIKKEVKKIDEMLK